MSGSASASDRTRLLYVCLERVVAGSAAATHVHEICEGLRRRGFEVTLKAEEAASRDAHVPLQLIRYARVLGAGMARLFNSDAVYLRSHFAAFPLALLARLTRRPIVHEINGAYGDAFVTHPSAVPFRNVLTWMQRRQYRWANALVAVTPGLVEWGKEQAGHDRVHLVRNGANVSLFRPDGPRHERARRYVLFFGGLVRWHGVEAMLNAARLPSWPEEVDLLIAGPIVDESLHPLLAAAPANVTWLGALPQENLPPLIRGAIAALVPISDPDGRSSHGVLPLKLFEALACGAPAIVTELRGQADLVREGACGLVVPIADPAALARAVAELAADPAKTRRLGDAGASFIAAGHSWDRRAEKTATVLREAIAAAKA